MKSPGTKSSLQHHGTHKLTLKVQSTSKPYKQTDNQTQKSKFGNNNFNSNSISGH